MQPPLYLLRFHESHSQAGRLLLPLRAPLAVSRREQAEWRRNSVSDRYGGDSRLLFSRQKERAGDSDRASERGRVCGGESGRGVRRTEQIMRRRRQQQI